MYSTKYDRHEGSRKARFYRSFRKLVIFTISIALLGLFLDKEIWDLRVVSVIWGIVLFVKYTKINGLPFTNGFLGRDWKDWMEHTGRMDDTGPGRDDDYQNVWQDKDLV